MIAAYKMCCCDVWFVEGNPQGIGMQFLGALIRLQECDSPKPKDTTNKSLQYSGS